MSNKSCKRKLNLKAGANNFTHADKIYFLKIVKNLYSLLMNIKQNDLLYNMSYCVIR